MARRIIDPEVRDRVRLAEAVRAAREARVPDQQIREVLLAEVTPAAVFETFEEPVPPTPVPMGGGLYDRQASLGLESPSVILVGCGGVGVWAALSLVLGGVELITLFDGDTLSEHNLNRFPLPQSKIGEMKSQALAEWLRVLRPKAEIMARGAFDPSYQGEIVANWMVCATDSLKSRKICYNHAMDNKMAYLEVGADGERWSLSPAPPEFSTSLEEEAGYQTVPVHVGPCMMAGAAVAYYVLHGVEPAYSHFGNWDKGPVLAYHKAGGLLDFEMITERAEPTCSYACPYCHRDVEDGIDVISLIKHLREDKPTLGLAEAKNEADRLMREWGNGVSPVDLGFSEANTVAIEARLAVAAPTLDPEFTNVDDEEPPLLDEDIEREHREVEENG